MAKDETRTDWMIRNVSLELKEHTVKLASEQGYKAIGGYIDHILTVYFLHDGYKTENLPVVVPNNTQTLKELTPPSSHSDNSIFPDTVEIIRLLKDGGDSLPPRVKAAMSRYVIARLS